MEKMNGYFLFVTLCVFGFQSVEVLVPVPLSVMEGHSVTLNTGVTKQHHEPMRWYFNDTLIALINGEARTSCLYDGEDGRFRDRLEVDFKTGSLTITNTRSEHAGRYEAELIRSESSGTSKSLNRNSKCDSTKKLTKPSNMGDTIEIFNVTVSAADPGKADSETGIKEPETDEIPASGLSSGAVVGIVFAVLLVCVAAAGVNCWKKAIKVKADDERRKREVL